MKTFTYLPPLKRFAPVRSVLVLGLSVLLFAAPTKPVRAADADADPVVQAAFEKGTLAEGEKSLAAALVGRPSTGDAEADRRRYALGIVQFLRAGEKLGQTWRRHGLLGSRLASSLPFLRLPVGQADPASVEPVSYEDIRAALITFLADIQTAEATFAMLPDDPGKVAVRPGLVKIDYAGNGKPADTETAWQTFERLNRGGRFSEDEPLTAKDAENFLIKFDAGDVPWFRGYCQLLSGLVEVVLAHDESSLFDHTAHLFFEKPKTPFPFLQRGKDASVMDMDREPISDFLAFIHLLNFPVREPARMTAALEHFSRVPGFGRESWKRILAETDDDHEWIPNPRQHSVLPAEVTQERIDAWMLVLDETDAILAGKKLVPFWRGGAGGRGLNLRRVFTEPQGLDLMLWIQGTGAAPYLEEGTMTDERVWHNFQRNFSGVALGFSLYFN